MKETNKMYMSQISDSVLQRRILRRHQFITNVLFEILDLVWHVGRFL